MTKVTMNDNKMKIPIIVTSGSCVLLLAAVVVAIASRNRRRPLPLLDVPSVTPTAEIHVNVKERKPDQWQHEAVDASSAISTIIGNNPTTANRYETRNDALRSIARNRKISLSDLAALLGYVASTNDVLRIERTAALKNDALYSLLSIAHLFRNIHFNRLLIQCHLPSVLAASTSPAPRTRCQGQSWRG